MRSASASRTSVPRPAPRPCRPLPAGPSRRAMTHFGWPTACSPRPNHGHPSPARSIPDRNPMLCGAYDPFLSLAVAATVTHARASRDERPGRAVVRGHVAGPLTDHARPSQRRPAHGRSRPGLLGRRVRGDRRPDAPSRRSARRDARRPRRGVAAGRGVALRSPHPHRSVAHRAEAGAGPAADPARRLPTRRPGSGGPPGRWLEPRRAPARRGGPMWRAVRISPPATAATPPSCSWSFGPTCRSRMVLRARAVRRTTAASSRPRPTSTPPVRWVPTRSCSACSAGDGTDVDADLEQYEAVAGTADLRTWPRPDRRRPATSTSRPGCSVRHRTSGSPPRPPPSDLCPT